MRTHRKVGDSGLFVVSHVEGAAEDVKSNAMVRAVQVKKRTSNHAGQINVQHGVIILTGLSAVKVVTEVRKPEHVTACTGKSEMPVAVVLQWKKGAVMKNRVHTGLSGPTGLIVQPRVVSMSSGTEAESAVMAVKMEVTVLVKVGKKKTASCQLVPNGDLGPNGLPVPNPAAVALAQHLVYA